MHVSISLISFQSIPWELGLNANIHLNFSPSNDLMHSPSQLLLAETCEFIAMSLQLNWQWGVMIIQEAHLSPIGHPSACTSNVLTKIVTFSCKIGKKQHPMLSFAGLITQILLFINLVYYQRQAIVLMRDEGHMHTHGV